jgi:hypothetical protein
MVAELHEKEVYGEKSLIGLSSETIDGDEIGDLELAYFIVKKLRHMYQDGWE